MKFGSGILGIEPPADSGLGGVAFLNQSMDFPPERLPDEEALLQAGAGQYTELDFRHPFDKLRTVFNQLPCLGV